MVLESRDAILELAPLLEGLAARCQQPGAMHWLRYFLDEEVLGHRVPQLVLFLEPGKQDLASLQSTDLRAAALFFEYRVLGMRTGVSATGDAVGFNSVIAPVGERVRVAADASKLLMKRGARFVLTTFESGPGVLGELPVLPWAGVRWALRQRPVRRILKLGATLDETLATMGKATRFNLRYYRRRLEKQMPCEFVPEAAALLAGEDLQKLNASSLNPVSPEEFVRRITCASELPGSFLCGLRGPEGRWLSLVGGWRQETTTVLYWQMNASGLEKHSIGTVMRSHLLEAEIARGAENLLIFGGTPHSMRHAFTEDIVADLIVERTGPRARVIRALAKGMVRTGRLSRENFVAETLCSESLRWKAAGEGGSPDRTHTVQTMPAKRLA